MAKAWNYINIYKKYIYMLYFNRTMVWLEGKLFFYLLFGKGEACVILVVIFLKWYHAMCTYIFVFSTIFIYTYINCTKKIIKFLSITALKSGSVRAKKLLLFTHKIKLYYIFKKFKYKIFRDTLCFFWDGKFLLSCISFFLKGDFRCCSME